MPCKGTSWGRDRVEVGVKITCIFTMLNVFLLKIIHDVHKQFSKSLVDREGCDPISRFTSAILFCTSKTRTCISNLIYRGHFCVQSSVRTRGDCLCCWYWWDWWSSLFKLSLHNSIRISLILFNLYAFHIHVQWSSDIKHFFSFFFNCYYYIIIIFTTLNNNLFMLW